MKKFTNFNSEPDNGPIMDRCWAEVGPRMDRFDSVSIVSRQSDLDQVRAISAGLSARVWKHVAMIFAVLVMSIANIGMAWADKTASSTLDISTVTSSNWGTWTPHNPQMDANGFHVSSPMVYNSTSPTWFGYAGLNTGAVSWNATTHCLSSTTFKGSSGNINTAKLKTTQKAYFRITGCSTVYASVKAVSSNSISLKAYEYNGSRAGSASFTSTTSTTSLEELSLTSLDASKTYEIELIGNGTADGAYFYEICFVPAPSCTAPSSVSIGDQWLAFVGEPLELTASLTGGSGDHTYQWYKGGTSDGYAIEGATSATYYKAEAEAGDADANYYCKVSTEGDDDVWSAAYKVQVLRLQLMWSDGKPVSDYTFHNFRSLGGNKATVSIPLEAQDYSYYIIDGFKACGNSGTIQRNNYTGTPWTHNVSNQRTGLNCDKAGTYIFTIDYSNYSSWQVSVGFPEDYYYKGNEDGWSSTHAMDVSCDGSYAYYWAKGKNSLNALDKGNNNNFLIVNSDGTSTLADGDELEIRNGESSGFGGTDIWGTGHMGKWDGTSDNASIYNVNDFYIIVFFPKTYVNTTSSPKICASTKLPDTGTTAGELVYFDNSESWSNVYYRIGHKGYNDAEAMTAVPGTARLYKFTTVAWGGYEAWSIANNDGWTNSNSIYKVNTGDSHAITKSTNYFKCEDDGNITILLNGENNTDDGCTYYNVTTSQGLLTHTATVGATTNGSIRLNWTDINDAAQSATSTTAGLAHTCNLQVTGVPNTGYEIATLTVNGAAFTSGNTHVLAADATIAATFSLVNYNVTYSAPTNGDYTISVAGGEATSETKTATYGQTITLAASANTGYHFGSWTVTGATSGDNITVTNNQFIMPAENVTVTATFVANTNTITLNRNGGSGDNQQVTATYNSSTLSAAVTTPERDGYNFRGWYTYSDGSGLQVINTSGNLNASVGTITGAGGIWVYDNNLTLYARWTQCEDYSFSYGTSGSQDWTAICFSQVGETHEWRKTSFTIPNKPNFYVGKEEDFWSSGLGVGDTKSASYTTNWTTTYAQVSSIGNGAMQLLPAGASARAVGLATGAIGTLVIWDNTADKNLSVGFLPSGYGVTTEDDTYAFTIGDGYFCYTDPVTISSTEASGDFQVKLATSSSYVACAQGTAEDASAVNGRKISGDANIANGKKGVFQMWQNSTANNFGLRFVTVHDVSFDLQSHGDDIDDYTDVRYNDKIVAPSAPTASGYTFGGWYKELGCTNAWDFANDVVTAATTLYAKWTADGYTVTYKANGGTGDDVVVDPATTIASNSFTAPATMAFVGWNTKDDGSGKDYAAGDAVDDDLTLYAQWQYKILYLTTASTSEDDLYDALKDDYVITVRKPKRAASFDYNDTIALIVLHESVKGDSAKNDVVTKEVYQLRTANVPVLNTKSFTYSSGRWGWGTPNAGKKPKCIYVKNNTYANLTSHPIFAGLTPDGSDSIQILSSISSDNKPIQPVGSFTSGKEGYTLALVPNNESGSGAAIHELSATQRGTGASGQYLLISVFEKDLKNLNANGVKLFQNAVKYLIAGSAWVPQYAITKSATNGSIATEVSSSAVTSAAAGSRVDITATPTTGYDFSSWSVYKTGDAETTVTVNSTTTSPTYFTMPAYAVTVAATFVEECTKPGTPTRPTIEDGTLTHAGATFVWDPVGATDHSNGYVVSIVKVSDGSTVLDWTSSGIYTEGGAGGLYDATGLTGSTEYYFIVKAIGADGYCSYGDTSRLTFTTLGTPYTITYHLNGASWINEGAATYRYGTGYTLPVAGDMTNTGYTFEGWKDNSGLTGSSVTTIGTSESGDKEFWAKWTENTYTITYNANGDGAGNFGEATGSTSDTEGHYVTVADNGFALEDHVFAGWNTAANGSGESYSEGEEIELTANMTLYAIWADDYTISWGIVQLAGAGAEVKPNLGGGNYTITASVSAWTGSLTTSMISAETSGVTITGVSVNNSASPKTITATFNVGASVVGDKISFTLDVPANGSYSAKSSTKDYDIDRCTGSSSGSDGILFSAEFKDSGLGTSDICTAANTDYTFTTSELKAAPTGGSIKASTTSTLSHMKFATNAISIAGSDGVIRIDLDNAIATNDLFTYVNVNSSSSAAYLRHTSPTTTTDQIALTVYNSKEAKVRLTSGFNGKTTLYIVRNNNDFKLHKAAVVRPAFLMLLRDDTPTSDTNLSGTDVSLTTGNYLAVISGGSATFTSPSSGNLKIKRNNSKNYINFNNTAGYVKIELNDDLQEGDVIGFDSYNTNELAFTSTSTRSTSIRSSGQLYTVNASSDLKGKSTFYIWQNSGSSDYLRGLQIARSGVAGGSSGTDKITTTLTWSPAVSSDGDWSTDHLAKETGDADFTFTASQDKNSLGAITYSSSNTSVATVNASGKVHIAGAGNATITATMAASGCYKEATVSYNITVTDNCADVAGTISTEDLGCSGVSLTVTGHTTSGETVSYQWYKDGGAIGGATSDNYTATAAGEYYVVVTNIGDGHCAKASTNTITLEARAAATASNIVDSWYVKNGRRTPDIALVQTENATGFTVTSGGSPITTFAGCAFYLGTDGIIYLKGQKEDGSAPTGLTSGDETLKFIATACGGNSSELSITIHKQESTTRPSVAFVVDGTKGGDFDEEEENHSVNTELYQYLDYGADETGAFDLTGQNVYSTVDEQTIREHYSQFDAILITDDPSTDTKSGKKSYVDAFGTMIDVRPILTMEAFVSKWGNWKAKGIDGNPESPNPRQYKMKLQCKDHAIFKDLSVGTNVETETIDGVEYWTVTMVDNTKSPYSGVADGTDTDTKPALQGFSADDVSSLLLLGEISGGSLYAGVERQEETAARLMLLGLNAKALPNALTPEGKKVIENALEYLIETDLEKVDDCSNYFTGATDKDWNKDTNWSKGHVPNSPNVRVRILSECVIYSGTYKVAEVDIATSGKSLNKDGEMTGKLTINAGAALIVGGKIRTAEAPYFNTGDLMPTTVNDLIINTSSTAQAGLVFNNDAGDTKATVNLYSLGRTDGNRKYQYFAIPMEYIPVNPTFANETYGGTKIFTYVYHEASGWERRGYYTDLYAFEGIGITTSSTDTHMDYTMKGTLASTATQEIALTNSTDGYNMVGNSWSAPIQIDQLSEDNTDDNIVQTAYIYCSGNDGGTGVINATDGGETTGQWIPIPFATSGTSVWRNAGKLSVIPAMQAYQIKVNDEATLTLDYSKVVRGSNNSLTEKLRAPKRQNTYSDVPMSIIRVKDSKTYTDVCLLEGEQFSEEFDNGWEAEYMAGDGPSAALYAQTEIGHMAVAAVPELEGTVLGFAPGQELEYTFTFIGSDMGYYLNDLKLKKSTPINAENSYTFTFEEGDTNRFYISSTPIDAPQTPTGVDNTHSGEVKAKKFIYNDKMYIMINGRVYSAEGALVK